MTIAYIRTYSNKQQTESQKNAIEQFAKAKKIEIDKWLKDAKNSSKEKNRLEDVIKNLQEGDILIVADVTRLSRKLMEIMHLILLCIEKKVALYCIKEGYSFEDNVNSKTLAFTFGLVSEIESKLISARTKEALTASKFKRFQALHSGKYTELTFKKEKEKRYRINIKSGIFRYT